MKKIQVDGGEFVDTIEEAMAKATYKVSFNAANGQRVRLMKYPTNHAIPDGPDHDWLYEPLVDAVAAELRRRGEHELADKIEAGEDG